MTAVADLFEAAAEAVVETTLALPLVKGSTISRDFLQQYSTTDAVLVLRTMFDMHGSDDDFDHTAYEVAHQDLLTAASFHHAAQIARFHARRHHEMNQPPYPLVFCARVRTATLSEVDFGAESTVLHQARLFDPRVCDVLAADHGVTGRLLFQLASPAHSVHVALLAARRALC